jgi:hypothetical protein
LCTTICLLKDTCMAGSNGLKPTNALPANTLSKPAGTFSAVPNVHCDVKSFFLPWVMPWPTITRSLTLLSRQSKEFEVLPPTNTSK